MANMVSLYTLITGYNVAGPSWIMSPSKPLWMIATGLCYLAVHLQMAGYDCIHCDLPSHLLTDIIPRVLKDVYGVGMNEIASTLKQTGYAVDDVRGSLIRNKRKTLKRKIKILAF